MIRCNLAVILAERNLKITQVSKNTGISRTTLTALSSNSCQGIQLETLNTLCLFLGVKPEQLISYVPFDLVLDEIKKELFDKNIYCVRFTIIDKSGKNEFDFSVEVNYEFNEDCTIKQIIFYAFWIESFLPADDGEFLKEIDNKNKTIKRIFKNLNQGFLLSVQNMIIENFFQLLNIDGSVPVSFTWEDAFFT